MFFTITIIKILQTVYIENNNNATTNNLKRQQLQKIITIIKQQFATTIIATTAIAENLLDATLAVPATTSNAIEQKQHQ